MTRKDYNKMKTKYILMLSGSRIHKEIKIYS